MVVSMTADTLKLIHACDVMMAKFSTTAIEAVAMDSALILLNLSNEADIIDCVEQGVARGVYQADNLVPTIKDLREDGSDLAQHREEYIRQYLVKIDGQSSKRVAQLIKETLSETTCHSESLNR